MAEPLFYNEYETVFIIRPDIDDASLNTYVERIGGAITSQAGVITKVENWGKRNLAYPVKKQLTGHYALYQYAGKPGITDEVERLFRTSDLVLKFMTVVLKTRVLAEEFAAVEDKTFTTLKVGGPEKDFTSHRDDRRDGGRFRDDHQEGRHGRDDDDMDDDDAEVSSDTMETSPARGGDE